MILCFGTDFLATKQVDDECCSLLCHQLVWKFDE